MRRTVSGALRAGRIAAERHMEQSEGAGFTWKEETVTDLVLAEVASSIKVVPFTRFQETRLGADWLWWWIDGDSEAFGMLVQAKRLRIDSKRWKFEFGYNKGVQKRTLLRAARHLGVPATYGLYLGTSIYRRPASCGASHAKQTCIQCRRTTVSVMPALLGDSSFVVDGPSTYSRSVALEDLAKRRLSRGTALSHVIPALRPTLDPRLRAFLSQPQRGARRIAQELLEALLLVREGQFEAALATQVPYETLTPVFDTLPADRGHFGEPYFPHILNGLRRVAPGYVLDAEYADASIGAPSELTDAPEANVAGVVVVRLERDR
ncbi:MAG: hypothetical protein M3256_03160 [Actinomycetota bacterium]|nr:hypothetical protein [Actinomycetota bacterium]